MDLSFDLWIIAGLMLAAGALAGFLAGVFGVGGGALIVPVLYELFGYLNYAEEIRMPLAVGSSLAIIIPTSIRSYRAHLTRGAVDQALLKSWALPISFGVLVGAALARYASPLLMQAVFVTVAGTHAIKLISGTVRWNLGTELPEGWALRGYGALIGLLSSLMGIGGGQISNIIMTLYGRGIHQAVATSAGVGVLISIPGAIGYIIAGSGHPDLPPGCFGFVSLIGVVLFVPTTLLTAKLGVRLAHRLSRRKLELAFGLFLLLMAARFALAIGLALSTL